MHVLLYSSVLYLSGIAVVLYTRPALMFRRDGRWKEFGVDGVDTTHFPFWLFCIVWAVTSYGLVRLFYSDDKGMPTLVNAAPESLTARVANLPAVAAAAAAAPPHLNASMSPPVVSEEAKPGYYRLDNSLMKRKGVPRYIYIGEEKPADLDE